MGIVFLNMVLFLILLIVIVVWFNVIGVDNLIVKVFIGVLLLMIGLGVLVGGILFFCFCGVILLIVVFLVVGVLFLVVMVFWFVLLIMDLLIFVLMVGVLDFEFVVVKIFVVFGLGVFGGMVVYLMMKSGVFVDLLCDGIGNGGCGGVKICVLKLVVWWFWVDFDRWVKFGKMVLIIMLFFVKWLMLVFIFESLMLVWILVEIVVVVFGGEGFMFIVIVMLVGVFVYFNGYVVLLLVGGLIE